MAGIARNPLHYTIGIPQLFFMQVDRPDDPKAVDAIALLRAYYGLVNVETGNVLNTENMDTCLTPEELLRLSYFGNLTAASMGGDVENREHTANVDGRNVIDKVELIRRSLEYTISFDEMNNENMRRFFGASKVHFPIAKNLKGKTVSKDPHSAVGDFQDGDVEVVTPGLTTLGSNLIALEQLVTETMKRRGANLAGANDGGLKYPGGVYYFVVGNAQQYPEVDPALAPYRNKILCAFFKYDAATSMMKIQAWPAAMVSTSFKYQPTSFDPKVMVCVADKVVGTASVETNAKILSFSGAIPVTTPHEWKVVAATGGTHTTKVQLGKNILKQSIRVMVTGQKWGTKWELDASSAYDAPERPTSTATATKFAGAGAGDVYFLDVDECKVDYETGELTLKVGGQVVADMSGHALPEQTLSVVVSAYSAEKSQLIWTGVAWAQADDVLATMRPIKGAPEMNGCALLTFRNTVGVSFMHVIPTCSIRPDGTIDSSKSDWQTGGFMLKCLKSDSAYIPGLPKRIRMPYGFTQFYRYVANDND